MYLEVLRRGLGAARRVRRSAIKILTVLNGVSGNALGNGTAGAFGACGATHQHYNIDTPGKF